MFELRWVIHQQDWEESTKVLQYRTYNKHTDYSTFDEFTGKYAEIQRWSEWKDVPVHYVQKIATTS